MAGRVRSLSHVDGLAGDVLDLPFPARDLLDELALGRSVDLIGGHDGRRIGIDDAARDADRQIRFVDVEVLQEAFEKRPVVAEELQRGLA